jgi:hypothetical protein
MKNIGGPRALSVKEESEDECESIENWYEK